MRSSKLICMSIFLFLTGSVLHAQSKDSIPTKKIIDNGSKGDIILGEKNKKDQLKKTPVLLHPTKSFGRKEIIRSTRKSRNDQNKKGS